MTADNASGRLDTESARAFVNDVTDAYIDGGGGTHWDGCHTEHPRCAALMGARNMALLLNDVERLRASYGWLDERFPKIKAEVKRIREEIDDLANGPYQPEDVVRERLRALLDDREETT